MSLTRPATTTFVPASQYSESASRCSISAARSAVVSMKMRFGVGADAESLHGRHGAPHENLAMCLVHPPIADCRLDDGRDIGAFAKGLHGNAGNGRDLSAGPVRRISGKGHWPLPDLADIGVLYFPARAGVDALAYVRDRARTHGEVARLLGARACEIARVGDLGCERGLRRAAVIVILLVVPAIVGGAGCEIARPLTACRGDLGLEPAEAEADGRRRLRIACRIGRDGEGARGAASDQSAAHGLDRDARGCLMNAPGQLPRSSVSRPPLARAARIP